MVQNLRNLLQRADLTEQEVRTLHGVVRALSGRRREDLLLPRSNDDQSA
jgi:tRNA/rRNA methyltransferase